ncbi:MAG: sodium:solute symporter [Sphingobacteriales bacterium]|nr:sodium:solute symporter [Sphingobacteriales bacterium]
MSIVDWLVLLFTFAIVIGYGVYKSRGQRDLNSFFLSNQSMPWYLVLFAIMGTQASAITFLSAPGQAYTDGLRFVQYYFGLPLAMVVIAAFFLPAYRSSGFYTAYEYLEHRFDRKTRLLTSFLFLLQRGLSTGISIYAPSLILSALMGWDIAITNLCMGGLLILYAVSGGSKAITYTQTQQLLIIFSGMGIAGYLAVEGLPESWSFSDALHISGATGKLNAITTGINSDGFNWKDKYNLFSGIIGGFFLALSYFGTDQSQVGRYLTASSLKESRRSLLMNGFVKIPMQFLILLIGALLLTLHSSQNPPIHFNTALLEKAQKSTVGAELGELEVRHEAWAAKRTEKAELLTTYLNSGKTIPQELKDELRISNDSVESCRKAAQSLMASGVPGSDVNDTNYIFLHFVINTLPEGLVGLLIAVIFLAAWGSIAAALNSLASTCMVDWHMPLRSKARSAERELMLSRLYTLAWGVFSIAVAFLAGQLGSLIEAVNILGSLFYGTILGIFCVALFMPFIRGNAVFIAALITEFAVIFVFLSDSISFLWLNVIGCFGVLLGASLLHLLKQKKAPADARA